MAVAGARGGDDYVGHLDLLSDESLRPREETAVIWPGGFTVDVVRNGIKGSRRNVEAISDEHGSKTDCLL